MSDAPLDATRALCNTCGRLVEARRVIRGEAVWLVKWCPEHGQTEALVSSDSGWYLRSLAYVKPGTHPLARAVSGYEGCPASCGLCPEHQQHTCVPILEITGRCDLGCPICLVDGRGGDGAGGDLALEDVRRMIDELVRCEGEINMLTLSGGEPTLHPELLAIVDAALRPEIGIVSVSTHGLELAAHEELARGLIERGAVISLQLDGFEPETYAALRGRPDLALRKRRLLERLLELGARLSLTVTLARGVNEHELPALLELALSEERILSMMVQPIAHSGRAARLFPGDPGRVLTIPEVVGLLADGSRGVLRREDFTPLPCSHPSCFALTYLLKTERGPVALPSVLDADSYLDIIKNQALLGTDLDTLRRVKDALYGLWTSNGIIPNREAVLRAVKQILLDLQRIGAGSGATRDSCGCHRDVLALGADNVKSIFIHQFMDRATFDLARAVKCCNHYPQRDGRLIPACVRNTLWQETTTRCPPSDCSPST
jgi:uncharacterized radical SAM superfamily Fe-S cluster-containing enzyme